MKRRKGINYQFVVVVIAALLQGCGSSSDTDSTITTATGYTYSNGTCFNSAGQVVDVSLCGVTSTTTTGYTYSNGICYNSTGQIVDASLCGVTTTTGTGYSYVNGICYATTGQVVDPSYCGQTTSQQQQCYGTFVSQYGSYIQCSGYNCSGQIVYNPTTWQALYCP